MIELRKADKDEALGDVKPAKSANCGETFSKIQQIFIILVTEQWVKFSNKLFIYNIIHLVAINHENQSDSLDAMKKGILAMGRLHITFSLNAIPCLAL
jgi:hypothetical protein